MKYIGRVFLDVILFFQSLSLRRISLGITMSINPRPFIDYLASVDSFLDSCLMKVMQWRGFVSSCLVF